MKQIEMYDALQIVLELARQNVIDILDHAEEHARQMEAIDTIEDTATIKQATNEVIPDVWAEDDAWPVADWKYDVGNGDTRLGYWDWVEHNREID